MLNPTRHEAEHCCVSHLCHVVSAKEEETEKEGGEGVVELSQSYRFWSGDRRAQPD